ncbi:MAG: hypothetical protein JSU90_08675 [Nitrospiraceae bacterium]|nr:MAG: hypothetical protein JSU90_08675 [Nitrospiraceae bacterium]
MPGSITYRLILLALLPVFGVLMYMEGQKYDPALIRFQSAGYEGDPLASFFPDEMAGFVRHGQVRTYTTENLYEYVNGHAEYFISAGFRQLAVGEYGERGAEGSGPAAVVDIYDMGKSIQAFGIVADESGGRVETLGTGATGFRSGQGISFVKGQYYVRIAAYNEKVPLDLVVGEIDGRIGAGDDPFPEFARLPALGEVIKTRFIREGYRGLDFVNNIIEREYRVEGKMLQVFLFPGGKDEGKRLSDAFLDYFRRSDIEYEEIRKKGHRIYEVHDPYEGDWILIPLTDSLSGLFGHYDDNIIDALLTRYSEPG